MKISQKTVERMLNCEVKVVLPKLALKKPPPNGLFKQKKPKSKRERISGCSDKENENSRNILLVSGPNLSLAQIEKVFADDLRDRQSKPLKLSEDVQKHLSVGFRSKRKPSKYSQVDSPKIKKSAGNTIGVFSRSLSINVPQIPKAAVGTGEISNDAEINGTSNSKQDKKTKRGKCSRKDSGIDVESPKRNKSTKRKYSEFSNDAADGIPEPKHMDNQVPNTNLSNELHEIIQSCSSHRCTDKIDRKMNNVETSRTPNGSFIRKDFVIRIQKCCFNERSKDCNSECTTSVVATTTECENIEENAEKICRNVAVEKNIGISRRVRVDDKEKNCTRIVQSEFIQTTKQSHKKIKLSQPSRMVTRRKAASDSVCEFFKLTNEKRIAFLVDSDVPKTRSNQRNQTKKTDTDFKKKLNSSHAKIISKKKNNSKIQSLKNDDEEPTSSCSQSYYSSSESTVEFSRELNAIVVNSKEETVSKVFKDVTLYREEVSEPSTSQVLPTTNSSDENIPKRSRIKRKKASDLDQHGNEPSEETKLRKSSRIKKTRVRLSLETDDEAEEFAMWEPPKRLCIKENNAISRTEKVVVPVPKVQKQKKQIDSKFVKSPKVKKEEASKKSDLPSKRRMKKSEALKKTERFNEQKKSLRNGKKASPKAVSPAKSPLPSRITRLKPQNNSHSANNKTQEVKFSSKTPETIPRPKNDKKINLNTCDRTPFILLDKLDASDISTYAITPLREDRRPLPSKSFEDYGIDDVNTDDSTDEEDHPKKVVPQWVRSFNHHAEVQFHFPRDVVRNWIRPPTTRFTVKSLFF